MFHQEEIFKHYQYKVSTKELTYPDAVIRAIGIPMGTNCASLLADLFLYSYEADLKKKRSLPRWPLRDISFTNEHRYVCVTI